MSTKTHYHIAGSTCLLTPAGHCNHYWWFRDTFGEIHAIAKMDVRGEKQARAVASMVAYAMREPRNRGFEEGVDKLLENLNRDRAERAA